MKRLTEQARRMQIAQDLFYRRYRSAIADQSLRERGRGLRGIPEIASSGGAEEGRQRGRELRQFLKARIDPEAHFLDMQLWALRIGFLKR